MSTTQATPRLGADAREAPPPTASAHASDAGSSSGLTAALTAPSGPSAAVVLEPTAMPGKRLRLHLSPEALIAIGMYSRTCAAVDDFTAACIGCLPPPAAAAQRPHRVRLFALVDELPPSGRCLGTHTYDADDLVPELAALRASHGLQTADAWRRSGTLASSLNLPKLRAVMRLMVVGAPRASYYLKVDTDTLLSIPTLRRSLLGHVPAAAHRSNGTADAASSTSSPTDGGGDQGSSRGAPPLRPLPASPPPPLPDYIGRGIRIFMYRGARLTFMQGSAVAFSPRAASALARWTDDATPWLRCPNRWLRDVNNHTADRLMRTRCFIRETSSYAEDLYTGMLLTDANVTAAHHQCMINMQAPLGSGATSGHGVIRLMSQRVRRCVGRCPISVHPLKTNATLWLARRYLEAQGCAGRVSE